MNRAEFMQQLEKLLQDIPENDRLDAIAYYNDYFDEAGPENEARVIQELGSPEKVASTIRGELEPEKEEAGEEKKEEKKEEKYLTPEYRESEKKKKIPWVLILILAIFASPMLLGIGGGLLGGFIGILVALVTLMIGIVVVSFALAISGFVLFFWGVIRAFFNPLEGVVTIGIGSILLAVGIVCLVLFAWGTFKWIPALIGGVVKLVRRLFGKEKKEA